MTHSYALADAASDAAAIAKELTADIPESGEPSDAHKKALEKYGKLAAKTKLLVTDALADEALKKYPEGKEQPKTQHAAATMLGRIIGEDKAGTQKDALLPKLRKGLESDHSTARSNAAYLVGISLDEKSVERLAFLVMRDRKGVRGDATRALIAIGRAGGYEKFFETLLLPRPALDILEVFEDKEGKLKERVEATVPALVAMMKGEDGEDFHGRWLATKLLGETKSAAAIEPLLARVKQIRHAFPEARASHDLVHNLRVEAAAGLMELGATEALAKQIRTELAKNENFELLEKSVRRNGPSNDDAARSEIAHLLGWSGDVRALPLLTEVLRNERDLFSDSVRAGAVQGLSRMARDPGRHAPLLKALLPHVASDDLVLQGGALDIIEHLRDHTTKKEDAEKLDADVRTLLAARAGKADFCAVACKLVERADQWAPEKFHQLPEALDAEHPEAIFKLAVQSLGLLFVLKARPYCPKETAEPIKKMREDLLKKDGKLNKWAKEARTVGSLKDGTPINPSVLYAKQFYALLLREMLATDTKLTPTEQKDLREAIRETDAALALNLGAFQKGGISHPFRGSVMHTFAFSSSLLACSSAPENSLVQMRKLAASLKDPSTAPYYPTDEPESARSGALRSVTFQLAVYQRAEEGKAKDKARDDLYASLVALKEKNFIWAVRAHATRTGTHGFLSYQNPKDALAPYFYWANLPYVPSAIQILAQDKKLSDAKKKVLAGVRDEVGATMLSLLRKDGLFTPPAKDTYPSSVAYSNPLAGLALLPMLSSCRGEKVTPSTGIVSPDASQGRLPALGWAPRGGREEKGVVVRAHTDLPARTYQ